MNVLFPPHLMTTLTRVQTLSQTLGSLDFVRMIYDGHPEYSLLAVKAPIEAVIDAFIEFREGQTTRSRRDWRSMTMKFDQLADRNIQWEKNIALLPESSDNEGEFDSESGMMIPVIQVQDSEWVVIIRSLSWVDLEHFDDVPQETKFLSEKFQTDAITMMEEDTSSSVSYELFKNGESVEVFEHADEHRFESKRENPPYFDEAVEDDDNYLDMGRYDVGQRTEMRFVDRVVADLGLYIPAVWYGMADGKPALQVMTTSQGRIARADWITIQEEWTIAQEMVNDDDAE